jgi:predicted metal-dependent phosphoesterase TrpH
MGQADLHIHTTYSWDGTSSVSGVLKYVSERTNLDVIAITDHDTVEGIFEALALASAFGVEVIPGCEISTADGHLLALFIKKLIPPGLPVSETILRVGEQGGLCIAAHPMARGAPSLTGEAIRQALSVPGVARVLVGIEALNAGLVHRLSNKAAFELSRTLPLAKIGSSDSHVLGTIGQGATLFPGETAEDLRRALLARNTLVYSRLRQTTGLGILGRWLPLYLLRKAGWVASSPGPQAPLRLRRSTRIRTANPYYSAH